MITLCGEKIGSEIEYLKGPGVYSLNDELYSCYFGTKLINNKKVVVIPYNKIEVLSVGTEVVGQIVDIIEPVALVSIRPLSAYAVETSDYGVLHVSNVKNGYLSNIRDAYRIGDIIIAKIINIGKNIELTTKEDKYGIIYSYSRVAKSKMIKVGMNNLKCPRTGKIIIGKLSKFYGKISEVLKWLKKKNQTQI